MSTLKDPPAVRLFMGIIFSPKSEIDKCFESLKDKFGNIIFESENIPFVSTNYYKNEMGSNLERKFIAFENLINRNEIIEVKIYTNYLEELFSIENKRTINIDPGYISAEHIILATGKAYSHRPYLGKGVYADLTLMFKGKDFKFLDWTYPDYKDINILDVFNNLRTQYLIDINKDN